MSWTQDDLDRIDEALATGATTVRHGDKTVTYRTVDELLKVRERVERYLNKNRRPLRGYIACRTGYETGEV